MCVVCVYIMIIIIYIFLHREVFNFAITNFFFSPVTRMKIERLGNDMKNLLISADPIDSFIKKHNLIKRDVITQARLSKLSDNYLVGSRRKVIHSFLYFLSYFSYLFFSCVFNIFLKMVIVNFRMFPILFFN